MTRYRVHSAAPWGSIDDVEGTLAHGGGESIGVVSARNLTFGLEVREKWQLQAAL